MSLSAGDGAATLTAFTAITMADAINDHAKDVTKVVVTGGGRHNPVLINALRTHLHAPIVRAEDVGWRGDAIEAEAFAYLAVRSAIGLPLSLPSTTGVSRPMTGGRLVHPAG